MKQTLGLFILVLFFINSHCQKVQLLAQGTKTSFRGLSIKGNAIWVSGSGGTIGKSTNGGTTWEWNIVEGYEKVEFRDIEALDKKTAIIMGIGSPAYILKTIDGGKSWRKVYENKDTAMFLDAMAFKNGKEGMVIGDPINNDIFVAETNDGGESWKKTSKLAFPKAIPGEAFFAASGSNIVWSGTQYYLVSGGMASRIFYNKTAVRLPTTQGQQMTGANGVAIREKNILVASGNYNDLQNTDSAFVYSKDAGKTWKLPATMPSGYRSSVCFIGKGKAITCGVNGIDISEDGGTNWKRISNEGFNVCDYNQNENAVYFAGNNGRLGKLRL